MPQQKINQTMFKDPEKMLIAIFSRQWKVEFFRRYTEIQLHGIFDDSAFSIVQ